MSIHKKPTVRQIQPIGLWGRLEAIRAPTRGKARKGKKITRPPMSPPVPHVLGDGVAGAPYKDMMVSATLAKNMATESAASDQASQEAERGLILMRPRLAPLRWGTAATSRRRPVAWSPSPRQPTRHSAPPGPSHP